MPQLDTGCGYGGRQGLFPGRYYDAGQSQEEPRAENAKGATAEMRLSCIGTQGFVGVGDHEEDSVPLCLSH